MGRTIDSMLNIMNFSQRKKIVQPIIDYLRSNDCSIESVLGLLATLNAIITALYRRLDKMVKERDKLLARIKHDSEETWLD